MNDLRLYDIPEVAAILGSIRESWLRDQVKRETIPHRRLRGLVRFTMADIESIIDSVRVPVTDAPEPRAVQSPMPTRRARPRRGRSPAKTNSAVPPEAQG